MRSRCNEERRAKSEERKRRKTLFASRSTLYALRFTLLFLLLPACGVLPSEVPPIKDETLIEVLVELHLLEARFEVHEDLPPSLRDSVLARYGVDSTALDATLRTSPGYFTNADVDGDHDEPLAPCEAPRQLIAISVFFATASQVFGTTDAVTVPSVVSM